MIRLFLTDVDGTLTDATYLVMPSGDRAKTFNTRDWFGMSQLQKSGCQVSIISGDESCSVTRQVGRVTRTNREEQGVGLHQGISDKLDFVGRNYIKPNGEFEWNEVAFVGDDNNDVRLLEAVGYPACPCDAVENVKNTIRGLPDGLVLDCKGGGGCVREFADLIQLTWYNGSEVLNQLPRG